ncbi:hypothetical protein BGZ49_007055 [Haplosporangium sp. Z 27]|nr:hypothetical protein BGZ49_007055 [Haplosporangium sp. Z 27]
MGVSSVDIDMGTQPPKSPTVTTTATNSSPSSPSPIASKGSTKTSAKNPSVSKKSAVSKPSSVGSKGSISQPASQSAALKFNPGHASNEQGVVLDKRKEVLANQSKQIAKTVRVTKSGPHLDLSEILPNESTSTNGQSSQRMSSGVSTSSHDRSSSVSTNQTIQSSHNLPNQYASGAAWQQESMARQLSTPSQNVFNPQQTRQSNLDPRVSSTHSPSQSLSPYSIALKQERSSIPIHDNGNQSQLTYSHQTGDQPVSPQQQFPPSYPDSGMTKDKGSNAISNTMGLSSFVPAQSEFNVMSQGFTGQDPVSSLPFQEYQRTTSGRMGSEISGNISHVPIQQQYETQQQQDITSIGSNARVLLQNHRSNSATQFDLNHSISSTTQVSSIAISSQPSVFTSWDNNIPLPRPQNQMEWRDTNLSHQSSSYPELHSIHQFASSALTPSTTTFSSIPGAFSTTEHDESIPSQNTQSGRSIEDRRMQKIAKDMVDCKRYDYSVLLPRHISQDYDEMWIAPPSTFQSDLQGIPRQLLVLPKDANFLADVFFENSCYYYPIINRAVVESHLMEPQTPQALFLLNIIFMTACKHLGRNTDIKRAVQFRERAREIQYFVDGRERLSRMQGDLLGSQVIYGVFRGVIGIAQMCGTHRPMPVSSVDDSEEDYEPKIDLVAESRSILANKNFMPEAVYQQRLWTFWGLYLRDCISRLYFAWPHGFDNMDIVAELPKVKGTVGLGGMRRSPTDQSGFDEQQVTGKRRGATMNSQQLRREKKLMKAEAAALASSRDTYRMSSAISDDDDEEEEPERQDDESDLEQDEFDATSLLENDQRSKRNEDSRNFIPSDGSSSQGNDMTLSFSGLSKHLLEKQSRGEDLGRRQGTGSNSAEVRRHLERMRLLLDAESDISDGGTYSRVLFLEEIKLWTIGRRVGLYLHGRNTLLMAAAASTGSYSPYDIQGSAGEGTDLFASTISVSLEASKCSERAWLEDKELQGLQAELIAWEQALPSLFKFRLDVDSSEVNHMINGKMGILMLYYYTITIMLQSSYLPIPQYLSSSARSTGFKSPESISQEYDGLFSRAASMTASDDGGPRIKSETEEYFHTGRSPQPSSNGYFNTAHQICTQLSNVLYHHVELLLDSYPNWCSIQCKLYHSLTAALRVSCLNARLGSNSKAIRDEAKAGFKMGSDLFKRQAMLPSPLTIRDWPAEEDVKVMQNLEEEFRELMTTQDEEQAMAEARSRSQTRDSTEGMFGNDDPGDHLLYTPDLQDGTGIDTNASLQQGLDPLDTISSQYDMFRAEHVFGLSDEGFQFDYNIDA